MWSFSKLLQRPKKKRKQRKQRPAAVEKPLPDRLSWQPTTSDGMVSISEIQKKQVLLSERMAGHQGMPLAIAMIFEGINHLNQIRTTPSSIRGLCERAISLYRGSLVVMPTKDEVAKLLGPEHDGNP